jgi:FkbM family methyltransferase
MELRRLTNKVRGRYGDFKENPLTRRNPTAALLKYLWINLRMHVLNQEIDLVFLDDVRCQIKKGDSISGNYFFNLYEYRDSLFLLHYLRPADCFVDVGANVGHYALIAARKCGARVIAVEPVPETFRRLVNNIELNGLSGAGPAQIHARHLGLSDVAGVLNFTTNYHTANHVSTEPTPNSTSVEVMALDDLCAGESLKLLKIDVEGYEKYVLRGATRHLASKSLDAIIIELNDSGREFGIEDEEVVALLRQKGYSPYNYDPFTRELISLTDKNEEGYNTIFVKNIDNVRARVGRADKARIGKGLSL